MLTACRRRVEEVESNGGRRHTALQQSCPGTKVWQVEQGISGAEADLFGQECRIGRAGAAGDDRSGVAEHRGAQAIGQLIEVLMPDGEGQAIFSGFRENERKALGGERLKLVGVKVE